MAALPPRLGETIADKLSDKWPAFIWPNVKILHYIFAFLYLSIVVAGLILIDQSSSRRAFFAELIYFPMQKVLKIKFKMSSVVVAPVIASSGRSAL